MNVIGTLPGRTQSIISYVHCSTMDRAEAIGKSLETSLLVKSLATIVLHLSLTFTHLTNELFYQLEQGWKTEKINDFNEFNV